MANRMAVSRRRVSRGLIHAVFSSMAVLVMLAIAGPNAFAQSHNVSAQPDNGQVSGFLGAWCAQGDPSKHASVSSNEAYFNLANENGKTSMGNLINANQISAPDWQFITGTLSHNGRRIDWSNRTFWTRCSNGGGSGDGGAGGNGGGHSAGDSNGGGGGSGAAAGGGRAGASGGGGGAASGSDGGVASGRNGGGGEGDHDRPNLSGIWYSQGDHSLQCSILERHGGLNLHNEHGSSGTGSFDGDRHISTKWSHTLVGGTISQDANRIDWSNYTYWIRQKVH